MYKIKMWAAIKSFFTCGKRETKERSISITDMSKDDQKDIISGIFFSIIEGIRISMATLFSIFVPQYCEETSTTCTLQENFSNLTPFNEFVIVFNFLSLAFFSKLMYVINKREAYLISHLEDSRDHSYNSFIDNLKSHPMVIIRVNEHNQLLKKWTRITLITYILNVIFSCVLIFYYFYDGFRSVTTIVANLLLVSGKLHSLITIYNDCIKDINKPLALSVSKTTQVSYNVIDPVYEKRKKEAVEMVHKVDV
jgi:hypothetical protein